MTKSETAKTAGSRRLLVMDTATANMSVALMEDGVPRRVIDTAAERNHSVYLHTTVSEALADIGWTPKDLTGIAAGRGPGSYTGVRIGVTAAKTMAWALGVPVAGISTLEAMAGGAWSAWQCGGTGEEGAASDSAFRTGSVRRVWIVPLLNARRGQAFTAWIERLGAGDGSGAADLSVFRTGWLRKQQDGIRLVNRWTEELLGTLKASPEERPDAVLFSGETDIFTEELERFAGEAAAFGCGTAVLRTGIQALYAGLLGDARFAAGEVTGAHDLLPNYTQLPEAEVKFLCKR